MNAAQISRAKSDTIERQRRQIAELESVIKSFHAIMEDAAHNQDILREKITDEQPLTFSTSGVRFVLNSNAHHWRKLAVEYTERAKNAAEATL